MSIISMASDRIGRLQSDNWLMFKIRIRSDPKFFNLNFPIRSDPTRVNNVSQSARLFTFCVLNQSECVKLSIITTKGVKNSTLF